MQGNKVILIGYVGKDLGSMNTKSGDTRISIRLATHYQKKNNENKHENFTTWHTVIAWNQTAAYAQRSFVKGSKILVEGFIEYRIYSDRSGHSRYITQIRAQSLMNLDR